VFVFDNSSARGDMPFPSYRDANGWDNPRAAGHLRDQDKAPMLPSASSSSDGGGGAGGGDMQLDIEEIYVALHLVCTVCRAVILGYNAHEKNNPGQEGQLLKFSELVAILPTG
jgi:hypothetical protein